jgi:hypothetical protein
MQRRRFKQTLPVKRPERKPVSAFFIMGGIGRNADAALYYDMQEGNDISPDDEGLELTNIEEYKRKRPAHLPTWHGTQSGNTTARGITWQLLCGTTTGRYYRSSLRSPLTVTNIKGFQPALLTLVE